MPVVLGPGASPRAVAANAKMNAAAMKSTVACLNKMCNGDERVDFYPPRREMEYVPSPSVETERLPTPRMNPMVFHNTY